MYKCKTRWLSHALPTNLKSQHTAHGRAEGHTPCNILILKIEMLFREKNSRRRTDRPGRKSERLIPERLSAHVLHTDLPWCCLMPARPRREWTAYIITAAAGQTDNGFKRRNIGANESWTAGKTRQPAPTYDDRNNTGEKRREVFCQ